MKHFCLLHSTTNVRYMYANLEKKKMFHYFL